MSLGAILAGLGTFGASVGGAITGYYGYQAQKEANAQNYAAQQQNYELQKSNLSYQRDLQQQIFNREDNAVARRKADLVASGFSPVLAAGDGANAGSIVATSAPNNAPQRSTSEYSKLNDIAMSVGLLSNLQNISTSRAQEVASLAQAGKTTAETSTEKTRNALISSQLGLAPAQVSLMNSQSSLATQQTATSRAQADLIRAQTSLTGAQTRMSRAEYNYFINTQDTRATMLAQQLSTEVNRTFLTAEQYNNLYEQTSQLINSYSKEAGMTRQEAAVLALNETLGKARNENEAQNIRNNFIGMMARLGIDTKIFDINSDYARKHDLPYGHTHDAGLFGALQYAGTLGSGLLDSLLQYLGAPAGGIPGLDTGNGVRADDVDAIRNYIGR